MKNRIWTFCKSINLTRKQYDVWTEQSSGSEGRTASTASNDTDLVGSPVYGYGSYGIMTIQS
jgi:hypothetical protein